MDQLPIMAQPISRRCVTKSNYENIYGFVLFLLRYIPLSVVSNQLYKSIVLSLFYCDIPHSAVSIGSPYHRHVIVSQIELGLPKKAYHIKEFGIKTSTLVGIYYLVNIDNFSCIIIIFKYAYY